MAKELNKTKQKNHNKDDRRLFQHRGFSRYQQRNELRNWKSDKRLSFPPFPITGRTTACSFDKDHPNLVLEGDPPAKRQIVDEEKRAIRKFRRRR